MKKNRIMLYFYLLNICFIYTQCATRTKSTAEPINFGNRSDTLKLPNNNIIIKKYISQELFEELEYDISFNLLTKRNYFDSLMIERSFDVVSTNNQLKLKLNSNDSLVLFDKGEDGFGLDVEIRKFYGNVHFYSEGIVSGADFGSRLSTGNAIIYHNWGSEISLEHFEHVPNGMKMYKPIPLTSLSLFRGNNMYIVTPSIHFDGMGNMIEYLKFEKGYLNQIMDIKNKRLEYYDNSMKMIGLQKITFDSLEKH